MPPPQLPPLTASLRCAAVLVAELARPLVELAHAIGVGGQTAAHVVHVRQVAAAGGVVAVAALAEQLDRAPIIARTPARRMAPSRTSVAATLFR